MTAKYPAFKTWLEKYLYDNGSSMFAKIFDALPYSLTNNSYRIRLWLRRAERDGLIISAPLDGRKKIYALKGMVNAEKHPRRFIRFKNGAAIA